MSRQHMEVHAPRLRETMTAIVFLRIFLSLPALSDVVTPHEESGQKPDTERSWNYYSEGKEEDGGKTLTLSA